MKITFVLALLCWIPFCLLQAQFDVEVNLAGAGDVSPYRNGTKGFDLRYEGVRGTPLLFDDWQSAQIQLVTQDSFSSKAYINVDLAQDVLVIQMRNGTTGQVDISRIQAFKIENTDNQATIWQILPEKDVEGTGSSKLNCYEVLYKGKFSFFKLPTKKFVKASYKEAYSIGNRYDEYVKEESYWLGETGKPLKKIKLKQKSIEEALPRQAGRIERLFKTQDLNASKEKDVTKLLQLLEEATQ